MAARIDGGRGRLPAASSSRNGGIRVRGATSGDLVGSIGASLSDFAEPQLDKMRVERAEAEAAADRVDVGRRGSEARLTWQKRLTEELDNYDGAEPGFAERMAEEYEKDSRVRLEGLRPGVRAALEQDLVQFGERLTSSAITGEQASRQAYTMRGLRETLDNEAMTLLDTPDDLPGALQGLELLAEGAPNAVREKFVDEGRNVLVASYAEALLRDEPDRLVWELKDGLLDGVIDSKEKARLLGVAEGALARQTAAGERAIEAERKQRVAEAKSLVARVVAYENSGLAAPIELLEAAQDAATSASDDASLEKMHLAQYRRQRRGTGGTSKTAKHALDVLEDALETGLSPSPEMIARAQQEVEVAGNAAYAERLAKIAKTQGLRQEAAFMDKSELDARISELRSGNVGEQELNEFNVLSKVAERRDRVGKTDNVGWAIANGARLTPIVIGSENLVSDIATRIDRAEVLAEQTGEKLQVFSKRERRLVVEGLEAMPAQDQAVALARLVTGAGARSGQVIREIAEERPALGQIGYLTATGRSNFALRALEGGTALKENSGLLPKSKSAMEAAEDAVFGTAIPNARRDVRKAIVDAARSAYAGDLSHAGEDGEDYDAGDYKAVLQAAAGRSGAKGGIGEVNGERVQLPANMSGREVRGLLKGMSTEDWQAFSLTGESSPSVLAGDAFESLEENELKRSYLISVGEGRYQVSLTNPKYGPQYVLDGSGDVANPKPYVLDLTQVNASVVLQRYSTESVLQASRERVARRKELDEDSIGPRQAEAYREASRRQQEQQDDREGGD